MSNVYFILQILKLTPALTPANSFKINVLLPKKPVHLLPLKIWVKNWS